MTNVGRDFTAGARIGVIDTALFNAANARIGVGDSPAPFAVTQTDLQGTANRFRKGMDATFPTRPAPNVAVFRAQFDGTEANFAWREWGLFNAATGGTMLCRVVEDNGVKLAGQVWVFEVTLTSTIGG